jgi:cell wall-associated NlpC family hydrolase
MRPPVAALIGAAALGLHDRAFAQQVSLAGSRWLTTPRVSDYRLSASRSRLGPLVVGLFVQVAAQGPDTSPALLTGLGADLFLPLGPGPRPYLALSGSGGFLDFERRLGLGLWASWSAGVGVEAVRARGVALALEARYQRLSRRATEGLSLGVRLGTSLGRRAAPAAEGRSPEGGGLPAAAVSGAEPTAPSGDAARVVGAALAAAGTPYRWGGNEANGFDCSGLIQYAYGQAGIAVPRRSVEQAGVGRPVERNPRALLPGDILAFSAVPGGEVTHVGLYLGDDRFVHSAADGVRISRLSASDPDGRWWVERWVGARRVLD